MCNSYIYNNVCPPVREDNPRALARGLSPRTGRQTVVYLSFTTLVSVNLALSDIFHAKVCDLGQEWYKFRYEVWLQYITPYETDTL